MAGPAIDRGLGDGGRDEVPPRRLRRLLDGPVSEISDRIVGLPELFGSAGMHLDAISPTRPATRTPTSSWSRPSSASGCRSPTRATSSSAPRRGDALDRADDDRRRARRPPGVSARDPAAAVPRLRRGEPEVGAQALPMHEAAERIAAGEADAGADSRSTSATSTRRTSSATSPPRSGARPAPTPAPVRPPPGARPRRSRRPRRSGVCDSGPVRLLVDGMNVIGSRPDGWWRDRDAAMARLVDRLERWSAASGDDVTVVFERKPRPPIVSPLVEVAHAPKPGPNAADDEIVRRVRADPTRARSASSPPTTCSADLSRPRRDGRARGRFRDRIESV